ncbi:MAG: TetR/AcrR family transcriptional regulator [Microcoleus sp. SIO2G3]|nr:TetR/AcrR family transcriptional regulator [Microcoleus sp. SIO2G3]
MNQKSSSSKEAVLDAAEQLFTARGYTAVTLKHVADKMGIKQASLYYHFPLGKEELYVSVMLRHLESRRIALEHLIAQSVPTLQDALQAIGVWLIQRSPLNAGRIIMSDLPELSPENAAQLENAMYRSVFALIESLFIQYRHCIKEQFQSDLGFIGGIFIASIESLHSFRQYSLKRDEELVKDLIELLLGGALLD